jgi:hypothetical protein
MLGSPGATCRPDTEPGHGLPTHGVGAGAAGAVGEEGIVAAWRPHTGALTRLLKSAEALSVQQDLLGLGTPFRTAVVCRSPALGRGVPTHARINSRQGPADQVLAAGSRQAFSDVFRLRWRGD